MRRDDDNEGGSTPLDFDWDDSNVEHITRHGVTPTEAEDVILDPRGVSARAHSSEREKRYGVVGRSAAGRLLFVAFIWRDDLIRVVTAYDATESQRRQYRRRR
jgi:uncharacterized protein